jgi:hypothetical protein
MQDLNLVFTCFYSVRFGSISQSCLSQRFKF